MIWKSSRHWRYPISIISDPDLPCNSQMLTMLCSRGPQDSPPTEAKALSPVLGGLVGDIMNVASAILDDGSNIANDVSSQGNALQTKAAADSPTQVSVVFNGGAGIVASIMSEVNSIVNDATGVIGGVVGDAPSVVGMIIGGVTGGSTPNTSLRAAATSSSTISSEPQEFLPQSHSSTALPMNSKSFKPAFAGFQSITSFGRMLTPRCSDIRCHSSTELELFSYPGCCTLSRDGYDYHNSMLRASKHCDLYCYGDLA